MNERSSIQLLQALRTCWPDVKLAPERLERRLLELQAPLRPAHAVDLALVLACADRDAAALGVFERDILPAVDAVLQGDARVRLSAAELRQAVREHLLLARSA